MEIGRVIEALNKAVALEHAACIQYKQHALLVRGLWRKVYSEFFLEESRTAQEHAYKFGQKIVALGGVPTIEVGTAVRQSLDLEEMLQKTFDRELMRFAALHDITVDDVKEVIKEGDAKVWDDSPRSNAVRDGRRVYAKEKSEGWKRNPNRK